MNATTRLNTSLAGRYSIDREIGAGGMATVYLARDMKHARNVALKVLSAELGAVLGVERFLSEIRVTANLQHPNLLPLFDSGEADGLLFYVMPYVEGESLRHRLDREKQLPIDEAVAISVAIANALDYAHRHGVIHRDLKPENVLLHDGQPLVADFGIALAVSNAGGQRVTQTGLSLGTPMYMSPEQATGDRTIDGRTDIYSLGALTYEMLAGEPPHTGSSAQAIIARLMTEEPRSLTATRRSVPPYVDAAVRHALEKLPADRFATAKEFSDALQGRGPALIGTSSQAVPAAAPATRLRRFLVPAAVGLASAAAAAAIVSRARPATTFPPAWFEFTPPAGVTPYGIGTSVAMSPNGRVIAFSGIGLGMRLYSRALGELQAKPIPGTENGLQPVFSPDGRWILFVNQAGLQKIETTGGAAVTLAKYRAVTGADWSKDGTIVLGSSGGARGLSRLSERGGTPEELTKPDSAHGVVSHHFPIVLADGKTVLFATYSRVSGQGSQLAMTSLDDGVVHSLGVAGAAPLGVVDGQLVYVRADGAVMAAPLDVAGRRVTGGSVPVMDPVAACSTCRGNTAMRLSRNGSLVALRGSGSQRLVIADRAGTEHTLSREDHDFLNPRFSPDGKRISVSVLGNDSVHNRDIWIYDVATGSPTRLTSGKDAQSARWTADGKRIVFSAGDHRNPLRLWVQPADGSAAAQPISEAGEATVADLSPDGRSLVFSALAAGNSSSELRTVTLGSDAKAALFAHDGLSVGPSFSPDGRWVAYASDESGRMEIYVRPYPGPGGRVQVSVDGGAGARWINAGRALVYLAANGRLETAAVSTSPAFTVLSRAPFFTGDAAAVIMQGFDVSADGQRVVYAKPTEQGTKVLVVLNWVEEMRARLKR